MRTTANTVSSTLNKLKNEIVELAKLIAVHKGSWMRDRMDYHYSDQWKPSDTNTLLECLKSKLDKLISKVSNKHTTEELATFFECTANDWSDPDHFIGKHLKDPKKIDKKNSDYDDADGYIQNLFLNALLGKLVKTCEKILKDDDRWTKKILEPQLTKAILAAKNARTAMGITLPPEPSFCEKFSQYFGSLFKKKFFHHHLPSNEIKVPNTQNDSQQTPLLATQPTEYGGLSLSSRSERWE